MYMYIQEEVEGAAVCSLRWAPCNRNTTHLAHALEDLDRREDRQRKREELGQAVRDLNAHFPRPVREVDREDGLGVVPVRLPVDEGEHNVGAQNAAEHLG